VQLHLIGTDAMGPGLGRCADRDGAGDSARSVGTTAHRQGSDAQRGQRGGAAMIDPIISVRATTGRVALTGIGKQFGEVAALEGIDLAIEPGEFFSLLGPSGSGKTTTLRI